MAGDEQLLVQESAVTVVSSADPSCAAVRLSHFLLPRADGSKPAALPSPPRSAGPILDDRLEVKFEGWAESPSLWRRWVAKLRPRCEHLWRKVGILDSVLATTFQVRRDEGTLLQLAAIWSGETNTFVFPWGEATVTLEDVAVLGGLPLLGKPVRAPPQDAACEDVEALEAVRCSLYRGKNQQPNHSAWAEHFLERPPQEEAAGPGGDNEASGLLEHGAFLAMWLSLFVLPAPPFDVVRAEVLPIAARLARGGCVALAPAALASIYSDLSALNRYINLGKRYQPFVGWAPLHILQLWVFERFPELRPKVATIRADPVARHHPWAARWHNVHKVMHPRYVHAVFMSPSEFDWRPYGTSSFAPPPEKGCCWVHGRDIARSKQLLSFAQCLRACELVGMRCIEHYRPHRVARQLGFDQDVPAPVARCNTNWEVAWATYSITPRNFAFIVPQFGLAMTIEYVRWWKPYSSRCATAVANAAKLKQLHVLISQRKRKIEVGYDANSGKKQNVHPGMPVPDTLEASQTSNKAIKSATIVDVQSTPKDIVVISDEEFDELLGKEDDVGAMHLQSPQFETTSFSLQEPNAETQLVSTRQGSPILKEVTVQSNFGYKLATVPNDINLTQGPAKLTDVTIVQPGVTSFSLQEPNAETQLVSTRQGSPILKEVMVQSNSGYKLATVPNDINLTQGSAKLTDVTIVQPGVDLLEGPRPTKEMQACIVTGEIDTRDAAHKEVLGAIEGNEKANRDASASNQESECLMEDCVVISRKSSGNYMSSSNLIDANTELVRRVISTKTLYYHRPFGWVKDAQDRDSSGTGADKGAHLPRREIGTREMTEEAFAAREAEKAELRKVIVCLKEEIAAGAGAVEDKSLSKT